MRTLPWSDTTVMLVRSWWTVSVKWGLTSSHTWSMLSLRPVLVRSTVKTRFPVRAAQQWSLSLSSSPRMFSPEMAVALKDL